MSPVIELALVLGGLYLLEGVRWVPAAAVALARRPWGGFRLRRSTVLRDGAWSAVLLPGPWLPALGQFVVHPWPCALSPRGVAFEPPPTGDGFVSWSALAALRPDGRKLIVGEQVVARAGSSRAAAALATTLRGIAAAPQDAREARIREALEQRLDPARVRACVTRARLALGAGAALPWLLSAQAFVVGPLAAHAWGWGAALAPWIGGYAALAALAVAASARARRRAPDLAAPVRFETVFPLLCYPPAALRFADALFQDALVGVDPVAAAAALLAPGEVAGVLHDRLGRLDAARGRSDVDAWFADAYRSAVAARMDREGLSHQAIFGAPAPQPGAAAYCPRCRTQYRDGIERCEDCGGLPLRALG